MKLIDLLEIGPGICSVIGSGGKSTLINSLAGELDPARRIICTTTHMMAPKGVPLYMGSDVTELSALLDKYSCVCVGSAAEHKKLSASAIPVETLAELADYMLVEADGSKHLPAKAHLEHEPVIPASSARTIQVFGASAFGMRIDQAAHRFERYAQLAGVGTDAIIDAAIAAAVINAEKLCDIVFINQADTVEAGILASKMGKLLDMPAYAGSLREGVWNCTGSL